MAKALFISIADLKKDTAIQGQVDVNKLLPAIITAQELEIENILGTDLYDRINDDIINSTLSGDYLTLKTDYIHNALIHYGLYYYIPYASYQVLNGGMAKWDGGDDFSSLEPSEVNLIMNREKEYAESYRKRLISYLCANKELYPEYTDNTDADDIKPNRQTNRSGLYLN